ncbi:gliding motility-associated C-terminal domain-containing protein [Flavobacteriales bacterium]|jgi:gliding motility-associated-like protein|nr:gliding motility-associated C-terminal domain-containing protein [Flavobacteriales bacterium]
MKKMLSFLLLLHTYSLSAQIIVDNNAPYDDPTWLVDNVLLGGGITASNYSYQGDSSQIGWFDAVNTNLGLDSGIVLCTGDIYSLDPINGSTFPFMTNIVTDPDLLAVANSVPGMIGQTFTVSSINDVAILEFDFIPTSDSLIFKYVFGSQEYFGFENTSYNDVFGFFLSGPGITGPWTAPAIHPNGSINLAIVPNTLPPLPISISSINSVTPINQQYFVPNQGTGLDTIADADGFTTLLTARALVQCGETYHIRLAIADGSDGGLNSYVWLDAGSFFSPELEIIDNFDIDSLVMNIPCNSSITLSADGGTAAIYEWYDSTSTLISTDSFIIVGPGTYWVQASSFGCPVNSDTLRVVADESPSFDFGLDYNIPCNTKTLLDPLITGGLGSLFYQYSWSNGSDSSSVMVSEGTYILDVDDGSGCNFKDTIIITEDAIPKATISGGGSICDDGTTTSITFTFNGLLPWDLIYTDGTDSIYKDNISTSIYTISTFRAGLYDIILADDVNDCIADTSGGKVEVIVNELPIAVITPSEITIYEGEVITLTVGEYQLYEWYNSEDNLLSVHSDLSVTDSDSYYVLVTDENNCKDYSENAIVHTLGRTELYIPTAFTPNGDDHNELFVIHANNIYSYNIKIYNKWGDKLFVSDTIYKSWDGTFDSNKVQQGAYYYNIEVIGEDNQLFVKSGKINVVY